MELRGGDMANKATPTAPTSAVRMLTVEQVADLSGLCSKTIRNYIKSGHLPAHYFGRFVRVRETDLAEWQANAPRVPAARQAA
jgi:excisionase family DNA binding protein